MVKAVSTFSIALNVLAIGCLLFLIFSAAGDVLVRTVTGRGMPGTIEYGEVVLVAMAFLALARTQQTDGHVAVDIVTSRMPPRFAATLEFMGLALVTAVLLWMTWASFETALSSFQRGEYRFGVVRTPIWPARVALAAGLAAWSAAVFVRLTRLALIFMGRGHKSTKLEPDSIDLKDKAL